MSEVRGDRQNEEVSVTTYSYRSTGNLRQLNELARNAKADFIIHTGDFGFYDDSSLERIAEKCVNRPPCPSSLSTD